MGREPTNPSRAVRAVKGDGREPTSPSKATWVGRVVRGGGSLDVLSGLLGGRGVWMGGGAAAPPSAIKAVRAVRGEGCLEGEVAQQPRLG